ncbi:hypothetical protein IAQ61_004014 [Plenodomus lingam]|uniref:uncharacterized protein n=1 Tax=Leptosphaeria maculans TaxID=5022 RepID=UPI00331A7E04|nr:hypothetical protein IAQ61_004014 [Plenodomus lingam]
MFSRPLKNYLVQRIYVSLTCIHAVQDFEVLAMATFLIGFAWLSTTVCGNHWQTPSVHEKFNARKICKIQKS